MCGYYAVKDAKQGARVYARFGDPDTAIDNTQPIYMAGQFYGSGRVFFMASGEMWRVRAVDDTYFEQFLHEVGPVGPPKGRLCDSNRGALVDSGPLCLKRSDSRTSHSPRRPASPADNGPRAERMLVQPDNTRLPLVLKKVKDEGREGIYVEQFMALQEGDYRLELRTPRQPSSSDPRRCGSRFRRKKRVPSETTPCSGKSRTRRAATTSSACRRRSAPNGRGHADS